MDNSISIKDARFYHMNWLFHVEALAKGHQENKEDTLVVKTATKFGKWLYQEALHLKEFPKYREVVFYHDKMHDAMVHLVVLLGKKIEPGMFNKAKVARQKELINQHHNQINNNSFKMLKALNQLEEEYLIAKKSNTIMKIVSKNDLKKAVGSTFDSSEASAENLIKDNAFKIHESSNIKKQVNDTKEVFVEDNDITTSSMAKNSENETASSPKKTTTKKVGKKKISAEEREELDAEINRILGNL